MTSITQRVYLYCELQIIKGWPKQRSERSNYEKDAIFSRRNVLTQSTFTLMLRSSPQTHPFAVDTSALWRIQSRVRIRFRYELHVFNKDEVLVTYCRKIVPYVSIYLGSACFAVASAALVRYQVFWYMTLLFFNPTTLEIKVTRSVETSGTLTLNMTSHLRRPESSLSWRSWVRAS